MEKNKRNQFVDIDRGIAMLLVVFGHTMTGCTYGAERSILFNIVWSLQMPLFSLISGYVTRYSRGIKNGSWLLNYVKRRTIAYILPWMVWSFMIRGIICGEKDFLKIKWLLWHMDSGYWFLATIWTISIIFGVSTFGARKFSGNSELKQQVFILLSYMIGMGVLVGIGLAVGFSFFAIKQTLYYMPFYYLGYLYGEYRDKILKFEWGRIAIDVVITVCLAVWIFIINRYYLFALADNGMTILLRATSSMAGCIAVCGLCKGLFTETKRIAGLLHWSGVHSLEIYLTHYLLLSPIKMVKTPVMRSVQGIALIAANYIITVSLTIIVIKVMNTNKILKLVLYGNKE